MAKFDKKKKAKKLRKAGHSVGFIAHSLSISKSTASIWCRDIALTEKQTLDLREKANKAGNKGRMIGASMNKHKKEQSLIESAGWARDMLGRVSERDELMLGIALYWAEGSKSASTFGFQFVNSDPAMIFFMYHWLLSSIKVNKDVIRPQVFINSIHRPRLQRVLKFWSKLLDLPVSRFKRSVLIEVQNKKVYENHSTYFGMLRLRVEKSTLLKYRTLALIDEVRKQYMSA